MNRDPSFALVALALILVAGTAAAIVAGMRADRRNARGGGTASFSAGSVREGTWSLVLDAVGAKPIQVIKEIRVITGLGLAEAKHLADRAPSTVLDGVDHASAGAAHRLLAEAGATVRITEATASASAAPEETFAVVMDASGGRRIQVIKEIRALSGSGLAEAKALTDRMPSTVLSGVDHATATAARHRLTEAGASVRIVEA
ncbi:ribosomal protein L7/L12 [Glycomyces albidus]|nr:ribosomal protein L7/L12 [Glycomyces albidus]